MLWVVGLWGCWLQVEPWWIQSFLEGSRITVTRMRRGRWEGEDADGEAMEGESVASYISIRPGSSLMLVHIPQWHSNGRIGTPASPVVSHESS